MEALPITESKIADWTTDYSTKENAREGKHDVSVERDGIKACLRAKVPPTERGACESRCEESVTSEDLQVGRISKTNVKEIGVVFDEINRSNSQRELIISFLDSMRICVLVTMVVVAIVTHIY